MIRNALIGAICLASLLLASPRAQVPLAVDVDMTVALDDLGNGLCSVDVLTSGAIGETTLLSFATTREQLADGPGPIQLALSAQAGEQRFRAAVPAGLIESLTPVGFTDSGLFVRNFVKQHGQVVGSETVNVLHALGGATLIDFSSLTPGQTGPLDVGLLHITADNADPTGPDVALVFDSNNPTGEDGDLLTPGYNNQLDLGNLVVIAEDVVDSEPDGLVDDPDDEGHGGTITIELATTVSSVQLTVIDIDPDESFEVRWYFGQVLQGSLPAFDAFKADNGVIFFGTPLSTIDRVECEFGGSGGLAEVFYNPGGQDG